MPDHLQSRSDDMHPGKGKSSKFGLSSVLIAISLVVVVAAILILT